MPSSLSCPLHLSQEIAQLLRGDLIVARQVKEYIPESELLALLEIKPEIIIKEITQDAPALIKALQGIDEKELLGYIKGHFKIEKVLEFYRTNQG